MSEYRKGHAVTLISIRGENQITFIHCTFITDPTFHCSAIYRYVRIFRLQKQYVLHCYLGPLKKTNPLYKFDIYNGPTFCNSSPYIQNCILNDKKWFSQY